MVHRKQIKIGEGALKEIMEEFKLIEMDDDAWNKVGKEEMDYLRLVMNGLHDVSEYEEVIQDAPSCHH